MLHIAVPGIEALFVCHLSAYQFAKFNAKLFGSDGATFQIAKDAMLVEGVQMLASVLQSNLLESLNSLFVTQRYDYATQIECDVLDLLHFFCSFFSLRFASPASGYSSNAF